MSDATTLTEADLRQFTGSENWYRHALVRTILYTDGARYVAQHGGAYWLLDTIALAQRYTPKVAAERFQVWTLTVHADRSATLVCEDGNGHQVEVQDIPFTDFPLPSVKLFCQNQTIFLPSEY